MKNKLLTLAGAVVLVAVLGHFYAKPLLAQVRAALVQNVDEPGRHPYVSEIDIVVEPSSVFNFSTVPANQRLVLQYLTVNYVGTPGHVVFVQNATLSKTFFYGSLTPAGPLNVLNISVNGYIDGGQTPALFIGAPNVGDGVHATLTGYLVDCSSPGSCAAIAP